MLVSYQTAFKKFEIQRYEKEKSKPYPIAIFLTIVVAWHIYIFTYIQQVVSIYMKQF